MNKYDVVLEGQMGQRYGILEWEEKAGRVEGLLCMFGKENPISGSCEGQKLHLVHRLRTAMSMLDCETELEVQGEELSGEVVSQGSHMKLHGRKVMLEQGTNK